MDQRMLQILEAAIQGFIDTGEPVSSGWLYREHDFGIKPAMIRLVLEELASEGFLEQPHHSAGRVPSDRGYALFAERLLEAQKAAEREAAFYKNLRGLIAKQKIAELAGAVSDELELLGIAEDDRGGIQKQGLQHLVESLDWENEDEIKSVIRDFEEIDERLARVKGKLAASGGEPQVFIGKQSPITKSEGLSVVMKTYDADGDRVLLIAVGPKRMDYKKALKMFKNL